MASAAPPIERFYLLDTNILLHYVRRTAIQQKIEARYNLFTTSVVPATCYVSEAELRSIARRRGWGEANVSQMNYLLGTFRQLSIETADILAAYIEIDAFSGLAGREMGKTIYG